MKGSIRLACLGAACAPSLIWGGSLRGIPLRPPSEPVAGGPRFTALAPAATGLAMENAYGDPRMWGSLFREFTLGAVGSGIATGDVDGDGWIDLFAVGKSDPDRLWRQSEPFVFEDITEVAGVAGGDAWSTGCTFADIDNDGDLDLFVTCFNAPNRLYLNDGAGRFEERAEAWGLATVDASVHGSFADYDRDGDLDLYLQTNIREFRYRSRGEADRLFRNEGDRFVEVTAQAGIWGRFQGHVALWWDFNHDGWPDLYIANDFQDPDQMYENNGDGTFTEVSDLRLPHTPFSSMGADFGDLDNDRRVDLLGTDMAATTHAERMVGVAEFGRGIWERERQQLMQHQFMRNALFLNTGTGRFLEAAHLANLDATDWTWAVRLADLDNDGWKDVFVTNGMLRNFMHADLVDRQSVARDLLARGRVMRESPVHRERNLAFRNEGELRFREVAREWGLDHRGVSFGATLADFDQDGDLDLAYTNYQDTVSLFRNDTVGRHRILIDLEGVWSNRDGIGAEVTVETASGVQLRQLHLTRGILSSDHPQLHFGLGDEATVRRLEVRWPSGRVQVFHDLPADRRYVVREEGEPVLAEPAPESPRPLFVPTDLIELDRPETPVDEFSRQPMLPLRQSRLGPALAWGEVDGDGRADVFVGGGAGVAGRILRAASDGSFAPMEQPALEADRAFEDGAALWLDLDLDGDLDLAVASGGAAHPSGDPRLRNRIYWNDGQGVLTPAPGELMPDARVNSGALTAADMDGDGRPDLFFGGGAGAGTYPGGEPSQLLRNTPAGWVDVTPAWLPGLSPGTLVRAALFFEADGDGRPDLLIAPALGPLQLFLNRGDRFERLEGGGDLPDVSGWWFSLVVADFNRDGRLDIAAGNLGLNTFYRASPTRPYHLFTGHFFGSGSRRIVEGLYEDGDDILYPLQSRSRLGRAFPELLHRFPTFASFAHLPLASVFPAEELAAAEHFTVNTLESGLFLSQGDGPAYRFVPFPRIAQVAPLQALAVADFNADGELDLAATQNSYASHLAMGYFNGGLGLILAGRGDGQFEVVPLDRSGFVFPGDGRSLTLADVNGDRVPDLLAARNDGALQAFVGVARPGARYAAVAPGAEGASGKASGRPLQVSFDGDYAYSLPSPFSQSAFSASTLAVLVIPAEADDVHIGWGDRPPNSASADLPER